jgi:hypothetical protein
VGQLGRAGFVGLGDGGVSTGSTADGPAGIDGRLAEMTSAEEAAYWRDRLPPESVPGDVAGRVVLLVVDATSSLWPITVASAALRRAGAHAVLPLLLHRRP